MPIKCPDTLTHYRIPTCLNLASGVREFYIAPWSSDTTWSYDADLIITGSTNNRQYYKIELNEGTASFTETHTSNAQFRSRNVEHKAEIVFLGNTNENRQTANKIIAGQWSLMVKKEETDDQFVMLPTEKPLRATEGAATVGVQASEENSIRITLTNNTANFASIINVTSGGYTPTLIAS